MHFLFPFEMPSSTVFRSSGSLVGAFEENFSSWPSLSEFLNLFVPAAHLETDHQAHRSLESVKTHLLLAALYSEESVLS